MTPRKTPPLLDDYVAITCKLVIPVGYDKSRFVSWAPFMLEQADWCSIDDAASYEQLAMLGPDVRQFVTGFLCLLRRLCQLGRMPVFQPIGVSTVEVVDIDKGIYLVPIQIPAIHHLQGQAYRHVVSSAIDLSQWMASNAPSVPNRGKAWDVVMREVIAPLHSLVPGAKSTIPILRVAHELGIPYFHLGLGAYQLGWGSKSRRLSSSVADSDSQIGSKLAQNKVMAANVLRIAGLPAPHHAVANTEKEALTAADQIGFPVVVKPTDSDRGEGVTVDVMERGALAAAFASAQKKTASKQVIIERQVPGVCHRLFVAFGELLYAVKRLPMGVFGDGQRTVAQLVHDQCLSEAEKPPWSRSEISPIDAIAIEVLRRNNLKPDSIAAQGQFVALRRIESTQWGGVDEEVTKLVHPDNLSAALQAAKLFNLQVAGVDMISSDIREPWHVNGAIINEVNFAPVLGVADISRSYIPTFFARLMDGDGTLAVEVFKTKEQACAFQRQQAAMGKRCYVTSDRQTLDEGGVEIVMPLMRLAERVRALTLRNDVDAIAVIDQS